MAADKTILVAKAAFSAEYEGSPVFITAGTTVRAGHPLLEGRGNLFEPLEVDFDCGRHYVRKSATKAADSEE